MYFPRYKFLLSAFCDTLLFQIIKSTLLLDKDNMSKYKMQF